MTDTPDPTPSTASDFVYDIATLVTRAQHGDADSFEILARRYAPVVLAFLYGSVPRSVDVEDILQEVLLTAFRNLSSLRNPDRFGSWLLQIARNERTDHLRVHARKTAREHDDSESRLSETAGTSVGQTADASLLDSIRDAIGRLPAKYRIVVSLRLLDELPLNEASARLGLKESAVRMRYKRGLDILRKSLLRNGIQI